MDLRTPAAFDAATTAALAVFPVSVVCAFPSSPPVHLSALTVPVPGAWLLQDRTISRNFCVIFFVFEKPFAQCTLPCPNPMEAWYLVLALFAPWSV